MFAQDSSQSRFARFVGPDPARRGSMFGGNDHESWGYEPFTALTSMPRGVFADAARSSMETVRPSVEEPLRNSTFAVDDGGGVRPCHMHACACGLGYAVETSAG